MAKLLATVKAPVKKVQKLIGRDTTFHAQFEGKMLYDIVAEHDMNTDDVDLVQIKDIDSLLIKMNNQELFIPVSRGLVKKIDAQEVDIDFLMKCEFRVSQAPLKIKQDDGTTIDGDKTPYLTFGVPTELDYERTNVFEPVAVGAEEDEA